MYYLYLGHKKRIPRLNNHMNLLPLSRAQYGMLLALNDYKPIYIRGPIYSGKTSLVKMLSVRLGRLLVSVPNLIVGSMTIAISRGLFYYEELPIVAGLENGNLIDGQVYLTGLDKSSVTRWPYYVVNL